MQHINDEQLHFALVVSTKLCQEEIQREGSFKKPSESDHRPLLYAKGRNMNMSEKEVTPQLSLGVGNEQ